MPTTTNRNTNPGGPELNHYLKAARPGSWLILSLALLIAAMALVWSFLGTMKTTIAVTGIKEGAHFTGYLMPRDSLSLQSGMSVDYQGETAGVLVSRGTTSIDAQDIVASIDNAYYSDQLKLNPYNLEIKIDMDPDVCPDGVITLEIVLTKTRPFDFLMN
ncbi:MAG: hypothetical protein IJ313_06795 [Clostridia bacterium]|nr:hypothetical protein [Clostridia bacterium]